MTLPIGGRACSRRAAAGQRVICRRSKQPNRVCPLHLTVKTGQAQSPGQSTAAAAAPGSTWSRGRNDTRHPPCGDLVTPAAERSRLHSSRPKARRAAPLPAAAHRCASSSTTSSLSGADVCSRTSSCRGRRSPRSALAIACSISSRNSSLLGRINNPFQPAAVSTMPGKGPQAPRFATAAGLRGELGETASAREVTTRRRDASIGFFRHDPAVYRARERSPRKFRNSESRVIGTDCG